MFWFLINVRVSYPLWVVPFPGQVVLGSIRRLTGHEPASKQCSSVVVSTVLSWPWVSYLPGCNASGNIKYICFPFLCCVPILLSLNDELWPKSVNQINPSIPKLHLAIVLYHNKRKQIRTGLEFLAQISAQEWRTCSPALWRATGRQPRTVRLCGDCPG